MPASQRSATGDHVSSGVVAYGFELPHRADALEVTHVCAIGRVHAVHIGVHRGQGEGGHGRNLGERMNKNGLQLR